jgi:hypothetical protein
MSGPGREQIDDRLDLERRFEGAMFEIYERAGREVGYWATRYLQMLRRRGGLDTARYLLKAKATSDGYARLRDAARLDLTVEAHVLRPEFRPLFSPDELAMARGRLAYFERPLETTLKPDDPIDPALQRLLEEAANAPADRRVEYRDRVAAFNMGAIQAMETWVAAGRSPGFACMVLEAVGKQDPKAAAQALRRLRARQLDWDSVVGPAIARVEAAPADEAKSVYHVRCRPR